MSSPQTEDGRAGAPRAVPHWLIRSMGTVHLAGYRLTGRRHGSNLVALAVNAWADAEPAWWLNLQAQPDAVVELPGGARPVHARAAGGDERARLWDRWRELGERSGEAMIANSDAYAARLSRRPAVVVLEPVDAAGVVNRMRREVATGA